MAVGKQNSPAVVNKVLAMAARALWEAAWTATNRDDNAVCYTRWILQGIDETRAALVAGKPQLALQRLDAVRAKAASYVAEAETTHARDVEVARKASDLAEQAGIDVEPEGCSPSPQKLLHSALHAIARALGRGASTTRRAA